MKTQTTKNDW